MTENKSNSKIHFIYSILFLILIIIFLSASLFIQGGKSALSHLNVAATIISITLGFLAIIYAYISNNSFSQSYEKINKATETIAKASKALEESSENLNEISLKTSDLREDFKTITNTINKFSSKIDELAPHVNATSTYIQDKFPNHIQELQNSIHNFNGIKSLAQNSEFVIPQTQSWSLPTLLLLMALKLSHNNKKEIDLYRIVHEEANGTEYSDQIDILILGMLHILSKTNLVRIDDVLYKQENGSKILALSFREEWNDCEEIFDQEIDNHRNDDFRKIYKNINKSIKKHFKSV